MNTTNYKDMLSKNLHTNANAGAESIKTYIGALSKFENGVPYFFIEDFLGTTFKYFLLLNSEQIDFKGKLEKINPDKELIGIHKINIHFEPKDLFSKLYIDFAHIYIALSRTNFYEHAIKKAEAFDFSDKENYKKI
ncbi:MAG: hypothetical protein LAT51_08005 [Flavobacteriaceae bacterium]|nr:hypothetical protein [Flavobacteriaceae bacterium]